MIGFIVTTLFMVLALLSLAGGLMWLTRRLILNQPRDDGRLARLESELGSVESRLAELEEQHRFLEGLVADRPRHQSLTSGTAESPSRRRPSRTDEA